jgi:hypothetical protein
MIALQAQLPNIEAELIKYSESYPIAWARLQATLPSAEAATEEDIAKVVDLRGKAKDRLKDLNTKRMEVTRVLDAAKKSLIDMEAILDESKPVSPLFEARKYEQEVRQIWYGREQEQIREREEKLKAEQRAIVAPAKFEADLRAQVAKFIADKRQELTNQLYRAANSNEIDAAERGLRLVIVLPYSELAKEAALPYMDCKDQIIAHNLTIKEGIIAGFNEQMRNCQSELLTHVEARRAFNSPDVEAAERAVNAIQKAAEVQMEAIIEDGNRAAGVAAMEAAMEAVPVVVAQKAKRVAAPETMEHWKRMIAVALQDPSFDVAWAEKNLGKVLTYVNKLSDAGTTLDIPYTDKVAVARR